ncbi:MAG: hypothetical protein V5A28_09955 [Haloarculaceae archaeon]
MVERTLEEVIQSVGQSLARANRGLGRGEDGRQYAVSELTVSSPLSRLSVDEDVVVDTEPGEDEDGTAGSIEFTVVPLPAEESLEDRDVPELEERPVSRAVETLLQQGYSTDQVRLAFDPEADAEPGTITSYQLSESAGARPSAIQLTVAGDPPEEQRLGAIGRSDADTGPVDAGDRTYRRREESDTWHFCRNCSNDPTESFVSKQEQPSHGELCDECQAKEDRGDCE